MNTVELYSIFLKHPTVTTDSRSCPPGSLFFALKGDKFDGNDYIEQALQNGAAFTVGDRADLPQDKRIIRADNAAAINSFVVVLPLVPVMAITIVFSCFR